MMLLALAPLILIPSLLHYSFKAGQEKRQRAIYKKVDQGAGDRRRKWMWKWRGRVPELSSPREKSATSALSPGTINMNTDWWAWIWKEKEKDKKEVGKGGLKRKRGKYNVTPSSPGVGCEGIKGTFEEPEDDSQSAKRVVSMITRSGEVFWACVHESPPQASSETTAWL